MCSPRSVVSQAGLAKAVVTRCSQLLCDYTMASGERGAAAGLLGWILLQLCRALTIVWTVCLGAASLVAPVVDRAPRRILRSAKLLSVAEDYSIVGLEQLPPPPPLPPHIGSIAFAGCANLSLYLAGAAYALQRAPGCAARLRSGALKVRGGSSGAFVGVVLASGGDCAELMRRSRQRFHSQRKRLGGCIGIYASEIRQILRATLAHARESSLGPSPPPDASGTRRARSPTPARPSARAKPADDSVLLSANGTLEVDVTCFSPMPTTATVREFADEKELLDTVLASCYIPLAYETPLCLRKSVPPLRPLCRAACRETTCRHRT